MNEYINKYKGIHPGIVLEREFKKRSLRQRPFAISIGEYPQTLNAITKGKRNLNTSLALKIEKKLGFEEGTLAILQTFYEIRHEKKKHGSQTPELSILRKTLFWDTDINSIDWEEQNKAVIRRVFNRGNDKEKNEILRFYGSRKVNSVINSMAKKPNFVSRR